MDRDELLDCSTGLRWTLRIWNALSIVAAVLCFVVGLVFAVGSSGDEIGDAVAADLSLFAFGAVLVVAVVWCSVTKSSSASRAYCCEGGLERRERPREEVQPREQRHGEDDSDRHSPPETPELALRSEVRSHDADSCVEPLASWEGTGRLLLAASPAEKDRAACRRLPDRLAS